jgi:methyl-accepting chemotaxis protein
MRKALPSPRFADLSARIQIISTAFIIVACIGSVIAAVMAVRWDMMQRAGEALDSNMRLLHATLLAEGQQGAFSLENGRLKVGSHVIDEAEPAIRHVHYILGGSAAIFVGDTRIASNVTDADGTSQTGTRLAPGPVHDAVFGRHEPYRGEIELAGSTYLARYEPVRNVEGRVIGVMSVGVRKADYLASLDGAILKLGTLGALLCATSIVLLWCLLHYVLEPLRQLERTMREVAGGDHAAPLSLTAAIEAFRTQLLRANIQKSFSAKLRGGKSNSATALG